MSSLRKPSERRGSPRTPTLIDGTARTGQGQLHRLSISDLSTGGCAVMVMGTDPLRRGAAYGLKINGLETLGSTAAWTAGHSAGLEFERPLHPAVADHIANLHPRPVEDLAVAEG